MRIKIRTMIIISTVFLFIVMMSCRNINLDKIDRVKISQKYYDSEKSESVLNLIYDNSPDEISELIEKLKHAKTISVNKTIKEFLGEGEFYIEIYFKNELLSKYNVFNSKNAYDELSKKYVEVELIDLIPNKIGF